MRAMAVGYHLMANARADVQQSDNGVLRDCRLPMTRTARGMQEAAHAGISSGSHHKMRHEESFRL